MCVCVCVCMCVYMCVFGVCVGICVGACVCCALTFYTVLCLGAYQTRDSPPLHLCRRADHLLAILSDDKTVRRKIKVSYGEGVTLFITHPYITSLSPTLLPPSLPLLFFPPFPSLSWRHGFCTHCRGSILWQCAIRGWGTRSCGTQLSW